jgi:4-amino-4-deoxy-L-arabinose transferase-like glycosyltransferase
MMRALVLVFLLMALYGAVVGLLGAAFIAFLMAGFVQFAQAKFAKQDAEWEALPQNAKQPLDTQQVLCQYDCECTRDRI